MVSTKNGLNLGGRIDQRTIPDVLKEATELHQKGKLVEAEHGYRQVMDVEPRNADAIHRLGQLLANKGDHAAAKRLFKALTAIRPEIYKPWFCLAQSCDALGHHLDAANAYREVIRLKPDLPEAFANLAAILVKLGRIEDVNAALVTALGRVEGAPKLNGRESKTRRVVNGRTAQGEAATA